MGSKKQVKIGNKIIGGGNPVLIQSMINIPAYDIQQSVLQAVELQNAGCEILRIAVPNMRSIQLIDAIKSATNIPLVADIHFDYKLALESVAAGIDKIRINPGNIGDEDRVRQVVEACKAKNIPIRVGVNSGSVEKEILAKYGKPCADALLESALYHTSLIEKYDYDNIVISLKSSNVKTMIEAYEKLDKACDYPLHLGVTEAGTAHMGLIKSSVGIGSLLCKGIGDTIRVSLTAPPVEEIFAAKDLLKAIGIRKGVNVVSCPTCGRTGINLIELADKVEKALKDCKKDISVAVMGCVVNGPGEAREADIGVAGGDGCGIIFKKGEILRKVPEDKIVEELLLEVERLV